MRHLKYIVVMALAMIFSIGTFVRAADFSSDLSDVDTEFYTKIYASNLKLCPIGNLSEPIELIVDLRGFIPLTLHSKEKTWNLRDNDKYFRFPVLRGLAIIYCGIRIGASEAEYTKQIQSLEKIPIVKEADAPKEYAEWIRLAYGMCKNGKKLFSTLGGNIGYNSTEPILLLFTKNNCLMVLSFEYEDFNSAQGQVLAAFEFSRRFKEYKKYYDIRNTFYFSKGIRESFAASAPVILDLVKLYMGN